MTENPRTIRDTDTLRDAFDALQAMQVRHLPVIDDDGNLVGMLSDRDLAPFMRSYFEADAEGVPLATRRVSELMSGDVVTVDEDTDVTAIVDTILEQRIGAVPVVDGDGAVTGIISYVDLLRAFNASAERKPAKAKAQKPRRI